MEKPHLVVLFTDTVTLRQMSPWAGDVPLNIVSLRTEHLLQTFYVWEYCRSLAYLVTQKAWGRISNENEILKLGLNRHLLMYGKTLCRFSAGVQRAPEDRVGHSMPGVPH